MRVAFLTQQLQSLFYNAIIIILLYHQKVPSFMNRTIEFSEQYNHQFHFRFPNMSFNWFLIFACLSSFTVQLFQKNGLCPDFVTLIFTFRPTTMLIQKNLYTMILVHRGSKTDSKRAFEPYNQ